MNKKIFIIGFSIIMIILIITLCKKNTLKNDEIHDVQNDNPIQTQVIRDDGITKINKTQNLGNIEISNIEIEKTSERRSEIRAEAINNSNEIIEGKSISVIIKNENGEIQEIFGGHLSSIPANEKITFAATIRADITNAHDVEFQIEE